MNPLFECLYAYSFGGNKLFMHYFHIPGFIYNCYIPNES